MRLHINERLHSHKISGSILIPVEMEINAAFVQKSRTMKDKKEEKEKKTRQFVVFFFLSGIYLSALNVLWSTVDFWSVALLLL